MTSRHTRHSRWLLLLVIGLAASVGLAGLQVIARNRQSAASAAMTGVPRGSINLPAKVTVKRSANWSGNVATNHLYEDAYGSWRIPNVGANFPNFLATSSQWVGIGLGDSKRHPLVQAGTEADDHVGTNLVTYYLWWQVVPEDSSQHVIDLIQPVLPGQQISVHIHLSKNNAYITLKDGPASITEHFNRHGQTIMPDGHAEWIDERTEVTFFGSRYPPLADSTVTFTHAEASAPGLSKRGVGHLPHYANTMWTCARPIRELAVPLGIINGTKFKILWKNFGHTDKAGCSAG